MGVNNIDPIILKGGFCPICEQDVTFRSDHNWLRDHLFCENCGSIPRERALFKVITEYFPNFRELTIRESSPRRAWREH